MVYFAFSKITKIFSFTDFMYLRLCIYPNFSVSFHKINTVSFKDMLLDIFKLRFSFIWFKCKFSYYCSESWKLSYTVSFFDIASFMAYVCEALAQYYFSFILIDILFDNMALKFLVISLLRPVLFASFSCYRFVWPVSSQQFSIWKYSFPVLS